MIDELRELHLGVARLDPDAPHASDQLRAAYDAALRHEGREATEFPEPVDEPRDR